MVGSWSRPISRPVGAEPLGDQPGVAAAADGAIDPGLAGLRVEEAERFGRQHRHVPRLAGWGTYGVPGSGSRRSVRRSRTACARPVPLPSRRRRRYTEAVEEVVDAEERLGRHAHALDKDTIQPEHPPRGLRKAEADFAVVDGRRFGSERGSDREFGGAFGHRQAEPPHSGAITVYVGPVLTMKLGTRTKKPAAARLKRRMPRSGRGRGGCGRRGRGTRIGRHHISGVVTVSGSRQAVP